ncbi:MAG: peptide ABC transporter substrate-binding protein [Verrucomicrobia bacterium]|nr:peptide ABC transporter substrate-binding protein [Verrucomicrobiota bacterium]
MSSTAFDQPSARPDRFLTSLALASIVVALLASCARREPPADLVIINGAEPESLDPAIITGQPEMRVVRSMFEGLTRLEPVNATPVPALAERWDLSPDGSVYTFHLRSNAVWSTGQPITADDVAWSWRRALDPLTASEYAGQLYFIRNAEEFNVARTNPVTGKPFTPEDVAVRATGPRTVRVELTGPTPFFLELCAFPTLAVVPRFWIERHGDRWLMTPPVPVNGHYELVSWRVHDKIRLRRNPRHYDTQSVRSEVVDFLPMESAATALNLYLTGAADIIWDKNLVPSELMDELRRRPDCHLFDYLGTYFIRCNVTRKPFDDPRVRKALALAFDKRRIVENITKSGEKVASHFTPKGMAVYEPPDGLSRDIELARKLLADAGFPGGKGFPAFQYLFKTGEADKQIGVELQAMLKKELGISMELRAVEWKVYLAALSALDYDLARSSWIGDYNDPNTFLDMFMSNNGNNRTGWKHARYDQLVRDANLQPDPKRRAAMLREAETILVRDELPILPLYFYAGVNFWRPDQITGLHNNLLDEHPIYSIARKRK